MPGGVSGGLTATQVREESLELLASSRLVAFALFGDCEQAHLQLTADVLEAAEEGVGQLAGVRGEPNHFKLQYVESAQTQVELVVNAVNG